MDRNGKLLAVHGIQKFKKWSRALHTIRNLSTSRRHQTWVMSKPYVCFRRGQSPSTKQTMLLFFRHGIISHLKTTQHIVIGIKPT